MYTLDIIGDIMKIVKIDNLGRIVIPISFKNESREIPKRASLLFYYSYELFYVSDSHS